jgi:N-acetylmuramoyl-L-alanine amidase
LKYLTTKAPAKPGAPIPTTATKPESKPPAIAPSGKAYVIVKQDGTNIRKGPSASYSIVTSEQAGAALEKISENNGWVQVKTKSGKTGWVANWLVSSAEKGIKGKVIVIDPGHGGVDSGAVGKNHNEKTLNLNTANELRALLEKAGAKVIMTRTSNTSRKLELRERVAISHKYKADVFISIHYNSGGSTATGIDTFYNTKYGNEAELAKCIQTELIKQTGMKDRGVKTAEFYVVKYNEMPSVLVELGFISNPEEEKLIATKDYQQKAARGIFNGLNTYFNR